MVKKRTILKKISRRIRDLHNFTGRFSYRPSDVIISSYPKSGSTWVRYILAHLFSTEQGYSDDMDFDKMHVIIPELSKNALHRGVDFPTMPAPRVMRSHRSFTPLFPKVIYLLRDGRDVLVSYYYHFRKFKAYDQSFLSFLAGHERQQEWDDHVEDWIFDNPQVDRLCVIRYEDMLRNTVKEVQKMIEFIGVQRTLNQVQKAIDASTFQRMREVEETKGLSYKKPQDKSIRFMRKGVHGGWREVFGEEEKSCFKQRFGKTLIRAGYESSMHW